MKSETAHEPALERVAADPAETPALPSDPSRDPRRPHLLHQFTVQLSSTRRGARLARRLAVERLAAWGWPYDSDTARDVALLVGELAANAAVHGRSPGRDFRLHVAVEANRGSGTAAPANAPADAGGPPAHDDTGGRQERPNGTPCPATGPRHPYRQALTLRVEVTDTRPDRCPPTPGGLEPPLPGQESGRGLLLVEALADRWGVSGPDPLTKTVWCELDFPAAPGQGPARSGAVAPAPSARS